MTKKETVVITGGAGFIGSHAVDTCLNSGLAVRVIDNLSGGREQNLAHHKDNPDLSMDIIDIRNLAPNSSVFKGASYVLHFAGIGDIVPSIERPEEYMSVNSYGTLKVLEACRFNEVKKVVYAASSSCYGLADVPTDEFHPVDTKYPYALSKYQGEMIALHWHRVYGLPVNSIRIFNAYGPRSRTSGAYGAVFGVFLRQKLADKPFTVVGDGEQTRDFLFVTDVARAFLLGAQTDLSGETWNLGAGKPQSINYLIELLGGSKTHLPKRPGEPDVTWANIDKIQKDLNWSPSVSFEAGVSQILKNIDYWREAPLWDEASIESATKLWFQTMNKSDA